MSRVVHLFCFFLCVCVCVCFICLDRRPRPVRILCAAWSHAETFRRRLCVCVCRVRLFFFIMGCFLVFYRRKVSRKYSRPTASYCKGVNPVGPCSGCPGRWTCVELIRVLSSFRPRVSRCSAMRQLRTAEGCGRQSAIKSCA